MTRVAGRILVVAWFAVLAMLITGLAGGIWTALIGSNLRMSPSIPWAVPAMVFLLWLMWRYLGGAWWPRSTSQTRRRLLRARRVSATAFGWSLLAGLLSIVALAGYWIVLFQLLKMPPNALPDFSKYPPLTVALGIAMGSVVAPVSEEAAFRGYFQVILEQEFPVMNAVATSSALFALAHAPLHGFFWPKLLVYFLAGVMFGLMAYLTDSIVPGIVVHVLADVTFFSLVWPGDAARQLARGGGAGGWFWIHIAQAIIFTALAIIAFRRLARISERTRAVT